MIVRMKKVTLLTGVHAADEALESLRAIGVLHVQLQRNVTGAVADIEQKIERVNLALEKIGSVKEPETLLRMPDRVVAEIHELSDRRERLLVQREEAEIKLNWYRKWGSIVLSHLADLNAAGIDIRLYSATKTEYAAVAGTKGVYKVGESGRSILVAQVAANGEPKLELTEERLPLEEKHELIEQHYSADEELMSVESKLAFLGNYRMMLTEYVKQLRINLELAQVRASVGEEQGICHLQGFAPVDTLNAIREAASEHGWGYVFEEPGEAEEVPTLIRNPKWVKIIDPVFAFLGTIPGYRELDISLWFLIFFALFVAILIGDAGYGAIYLIGALIARRKLKKLPPEPFILIYVLSICTILWGVASGTYFGSETLARVPFLKALVIDSISSFDLTQGGYNDNGPFLMKLCFRIGAVHLTLAHLLAAGKISNSPKALAEIGWISIIWGLYCLTGKLVLGQPFPGYGYVLIAGGSAVALLFTNFQKNILKGVGQTLVEFPLGLIGGFSDVVSYLRLFAVGYTSLVLASTFNNMAVGEGKWSALTAVMAALILFFGHSLNMVLAVLGVVVHGVRLKMLEFSGHLGNEWSGSEYDPFREKSGELPQA